MLMVNQRVSTLLFRWEMRLTLVGYHATTATHFAEGFGKALSLSTTETLAMRTRARKSAKRFTEEEFAKGWLKALNELVALRKERLTS
jgi:alpha-1,2-mannosyltransferase